MATLKQRLNRKNSSGTYDTVHLETSSEVVKRPSGETVENDLTNYLPKVQNSDSVPQSLKSGQIVTGQTGLIYKGKDGTGRVITPDSYITRSEIGDIGAMNDELVLYGKNMIADAITFKGVSTVNTDTFEQMASNIRNITGNIGVVPNASDIMLTSNVYAYAYWYITENNESNLRSIQGYFNNDTNGLKSKLKSTTGSKDGHCILVIPNLNLSAYNKIEMHRAYGYGNKTWAGAVTNSSAVLGSIIGDNSNTDSNCTVDLNLLSNKTNVTIFVYNTGYNGLRFESILLL